MSMNQSDANSASGVLYMLAHQPSTSDVQKQSLLRVSKHLDEQIARMNQPLFNPPAFPRDHAQDGHNGMDLRDYFAARIMATFLHGAVLPPGFDASEQIAFTAMRSYECADAMLRERDK